MTKDEALKLALEALDCIYSPLHVREIEKVGNAMKAIKEALAQPEQEPVATVAEVHMSRYTIEWTNGSLPEGTKLYTTPPQRKPLTDERISGLWDGHTIH